MQLEDAISTLLSFLSPLTLSLPPSLPTPHTHPPTHPQDGSLSLTSHAGDGIDKWYSIGGLSWGRDNVKNFFVNMCLYYSKGMSDYVGVWDFDEFLIPKGRYKTLPQVLGAMEHPGGAMGYFHPEGTDHVKLFESGWKVRATHHISRCHTLRMSNSPM